MIITCLFNFNTWIVVEFLISHCWFLLPDSTMHSFLAWYAEGVLALLSRLNIRNNHSTAVCALRSPQQHHTWANSIKFGCVWFECGFMLFVWSVGGGGCDLQPFAALCEASESLQANLMMKLAAPSLLNDYCKQQIQRSSLKWDFLFLFLCPNGKDDSLYLSHFVVPEDKDFRSLISCSSIYKILTILTTNMSILFKQEKVTVFAVGLLLAVDKYIIGSFVWIVFSFIWLRNLF